MTVQIASTGTAAATSLRDNRIEQYGRGGAQSTGSPSAAPAEGAVVVDLTTAISRQNQASAATHVGDLDAAQQLVKQLVSQLTGQPAGAGATAAAGSPSPRAVLSLLG
jgi:hypothetical protein